jgi:type VI protein secretion system component Hcp
MGVSIFLKLAGIPGDSLDPGHKSEIELISWAWTSPRPAPGSDRAAQPGPGEMVCTKATDIASNALGFYSMNGKVIVDGALSVTQIGDNENDLIVLTMKNIVITKFLTLKLPGGGGTGEQFSMNFDGFEAKFAQHAIGPASALGMGYTVDP